MNWLHFLARVNDVLTASVGATAFALLLYLYFHNRRSRVARHFNELLGCIIIVYLVDILLHGSHNHALSEKLLRFQWLGIAFTPAFYLEFTRAIQLAVQENHYPRWLRAGNFLISGIVTLLAFFTDLVVHNGVTSAGVLHLHAGPLFYPFALLFAAVTLWGLRVTLQAQRRCYTSAARRRMSYLSIGFVAPAIGVFPYLLIIGWPAALPSPLLWILLIISNLAIAGMLALIAYSVAFIGALSPERVIKHRLVRFLLRGPVTALLALSVFGLGLTGEQQFGLESHTLSLVMVAITIILAQLGVELGKPFLDLALYRQGRQEVAQIQELSQRLLTTADIAQFLENILAAMCELLSSPGGFIATWQAEQLHREIWCGLHISEEEVANFPFPKTAQVLQTSGFLIWDDYWVSALKDKSGEHHLGLVGLQKPSVSLPLSPNQNQQLKELLAQTNAALEDRRLQELILQAFSPLYDELQNIQQRQSELRYEQAAAPQFTHVDHAEVAAQVHDALAHYWGGPRLTKNPLLDLQIVQQSSAQHDYSTIKALRAILSEGIERLRPDGKRQLTAPAWLLYNILEMKFLRGKTVREVALRLAVSESSFYRKQRVAIDNLTRIIVEMEEGAHQEQIPPPDNQ
ncbi:MAG: histidine kinase N-terminal 7TM domain-containing protein [Chloroflexota bacterium]|nr:histidine kinase N-terminal 7TM domain-containing protein [Chloroflexota bacterium]